MPSLLDLQLLPSPLVDPLSYPGATLRHSFLWLDSWVYRIRPELGVGRSGWGVHIDGGPLAPRGAVGCLDDALQVTGAPSMTERWPVLAFGSNAAPAQLSTKFGLLSPVRRTIPVLRGSVAGLALGHSPHVSIPGYLPYVIVDGGPGAALDAFVLWLDPDQRAALDRTEPNYRLVRMPAERFPLHIDGLDSIGAYGAYKGVWSALRWPGEPWPARAASQQEVFGRLGREPWFAELLGPGDARSWMPRLAADPVLRDAVRDGFVANGMVVGDGWQQDGWPEPP
jgi:hypothetical protein